MDVALSVALEPLISRHIFGNADQAIQELVRTYAMQQVNTLQRDIERFEIKYGMRFDRFVEYLHVRSVLLTEGEMSDLQRQSLGQAIMEEEEDWLEWKAAREILESWLGLRQEVGEWSR